MKDARVFVAGTVAHLLNVSVAGDPMFGNSSCRYGHSIPPASSQHSIDFSNQVALSQSPHWNTLPQ